MSESNLEMVCELMKEMSVPELIKVTEFSQKEQNRKNYQAKRELKKELSNLLNKYNFKSIEEVNEKKQRKEKKHPPRYQFDNLTWSGYGNRPLWIDEKANEMNLTREEFLQRFEINPKV